MHLGLDLSMASHMPLRSAVNVGEGQRANKYTVFLVWTALLSTTAQSQPP